PPFPHPRGLQLGADRPGLRRRRPLGHRHGRPQRPHRPRLRL
ncbi:MAG: hypothetical protein AVDCRST_MAG76-2458, partial [uncultured Acidimicrobiales bacterium]